jgi:hypothetical protein
MGRGLRAAEVVALKASDIDSKRMISASSRPRPVVQKRKSNMLPWSD